MATSSAPSATRACCQKSPKPRTRRASRASSTSAGVRPSSSHPELNVTLTWASASRSTDETWQRRPSTNVPAPRAAHQRAPSAGAETAATTTSIAVLGVGEGDERRPHRDPAHEARRPVDRVDDPLPRRSLARAAELLTEQPVVGTGGGEPLGDRRLGGAVDLGDLAAVGLPLDVEAAGQEGGQRDRVGGVGELERELEVGGPLHDQSHPVGVSSVRGSCGRCRRRRGRAAPRMWSGLAACGMNRAGMPKTWTGTAGASAPIRSAIVIPIPPSRTPSSTVTTSAVGGGVGEHLVVERRAAAHVPHRDLDPVGGERRRPPSRRRRAACRRRARTRSRRPAAARRTERASSPAPTSCSADLPRLAAGVADGDRPVVGERRSRRAASAAVPARSTGRAPACPAPGRASPGRRRRDGSARRGR